MARQTVCLCHGELQQVHENLYCDVYQLHMCATEEPFNVEFYTGMGTVKYCKITAGAQSELQQVR